MILISKSFISAIYISMIFDTNNHPGGTSWL
jgi:hypothetical protein